MIEIFYTVETVIPLWQIMLLLLLSTIVMLHGKTKLELLINYLFTLNWCYFANRDQIFANIDNPDQFITIYFGIGIVIGFLVAIGFLFQSK